MTHPILGKLPPRPTDDYEVADIPGMVPTRIAAEQLIAAGVDPGKVASSLNLPLSAVRAVATFRYREPASPEEAALNDRILELADHCIDAAWWWIDHGPDTVKVSLLKLILGTTIRRVRSQPEAESEEINELRLIWESHADTMRQVPAINVASHPEDFDDLDYDTDDV